MQQFRKEDIIRTRLNEFCETEPFTEVLEAGPNIYYLEVRHDKQYPTPTDLFGFEYSSTDTIELTNNLTITVLHIGYTTDSIRYIEVKIITDTTEYL